MKGLLILTIIFPALFRAQEVLAQDTTSRFSLMLSPALFTPVSVAWQTGVQLKVKKYSSLLFEFAYPAFYPSNTDYEKINYSRAGIELKFYSKKPKASKRYFSVQATYLYRKLTDDGTGTVHAKDGEYRYDEAVIYSPVYALAGKIGQELPLSKTFVADVFFGLGVRHLANRYLAKNLRITSLQRERETLDWLFPDEGWRFNYAVTRVHVTAGLRLGLRL